MLYKKYHRNFVSQFKIGARFKFRFSNGTEDIIEVIKKPYICDRVVELEVVDGFFAIIDLKKGRKIKVECYAV